MLLRNDASNVQAHWLFNYTECLKIMTHNLRKGLGRLRTRSGCVSNQDEPTGDSTLYIISLSILGDNLVPIWYANCIMIGDILVPIWY